MFELHQSREMPLHGMSEYGNEVDRAGSGLHAARVVRELENGDVVIEIAKQREHGFSAVHDGGVSGVEDNLESRMRDV